MRLQEVFNKHNTCQVVLSFTTNSEVLITAEDFEPNSKFRRMSRVRLSVDFELSGVIKDGVFIRNTGYELSDNHNETAAYVYRTYRGHDKNDYVLYVYQGEYKLIEHYKKAVSHKKVLDSTKERVIKEPKYDIPPAPDKVLCIYPHIICDKNDKAYYISFKHDDFKTDYVTKQYPYSFNDVNAYLKATVTGLSIATKYIDRVTRIEIHIPHNDYAKGIYMLPTGKWKAHQSNTKGYVNTMLEMRRYFQRHGISICFMV